MVRTGRFRGFCGAVPAVRWLPILVLVGCGSDSVPPDLTDAAPPIDVLPDLPTPPAGCDFGELADPTNDYTLGNGVPERTDLTLGQTTVICGRIDNGHVIDQSVDIDTYKLAVTARTPILVSLGFPGGTPPALGSIAVEIREETTQLLESGVVLGSHATFQSTLRAGNYLVIVTASNPTDITTPIDYKLRLTTDSPDRCARVTAAAAYTEQNDGPQSDRNDVVDVHYTPDTRALTAANNDDPEPTALTTAAGASVRISGTSAAVDATDEFKDRDTYLIATGAHDELAVRVDWTGDADFDFLLFPENTVAEIGRGSSVGKTAPETNTFPVLPNTNYWLWVGSYDSSAGLPINYDISLCPTLFAP